MNQRTWLIINLLLYLFILIGFGLRLVFIDSNIFHPDEFLSLLAVSRITELGLPILPSGRFYDTGLLYSYVAAIFAIALGPEEGFIRWSSLWFSLLMIPLSYQAVRKIFLTRWAGLLAALTFAVYSEAMLWGGRVRMYSLGQFLYLLALLFIWVGFSRSNRPRRVVGYIFFFLGLLTHFGPVLMLPALALALFVVIALDGGQRFNWQMLRGKEWTGELLLIAALMIGSWFSYQISFHADVVTTTQLETIHQPTNLFFQITSSVLNSSAFWSGWESIWHYLSTGSQKPLAILAGVGLLCLGWRYTTKNRTGSARAALFIALSAGLLILEMLTLLDGSLRHGRYYFVVLFPLLVMLAAYAVKELALLAEYLVDRLGQLQLRPERWLLKLLPVCALSIWLIAAFYKDTQAELSESFEKYRYDLAWRYVAQARQPGDTTMSAWPAAAYLYNGQIDYYVQQTGPVVMPGDTKDVLVDKYASALFIYSSDELNKVLAQPGHTWFVIEDANLFNFFEPEFIEQIFQQMRPARSFDNMHVFVEKDSLWPLPEKPDRATQVDLSGQMIFKGYTLQPGQPAGQSIVLTLFWQPLNPIFNYKVFVHLRNAAGDTVAQADFVPLEGATVDLKGWVRRSRGAQLRTATVLNLPAVLPKDSYTLWIGLYEPSTLQRVPVVQDASGENAIQLTNFQVGLENSFIVSK
jgi:hypothetical protein